MIAAVRTLVQGVFTSSHTITKPAPLVAHCNPLTKAPNDLSCSGNVRPAYSTVLQLAWEELCVCLQGPVCCLSDGVICLQCLTAVVSKLRRVSVVRPQFSTLISCTPVAFIICDLMYTLISCFGTRLANSVPYLLGFIFSVRYFSQGSVFPKKPNIPGAVCVPKAQYSRGCICSRVTLVQTLWSLT